MRSSTHLFIVTGASRGLGAALAQRLLQPGHHLLTISRRPDDALVAVEGARLEQWAQDLVRPLDAARRLSEWLAAFDATQLGGATLVNNAALLLPPGPLDADSAGSLSDAVRVGLEAPLLLSAAFLRASRAWPGPRRVLHISSGLGRRAMAGSAAYCSVKAGLDHLARAMALDEAGRANGARIVSLAPGVIDTDMQAQLRGADPARFAEQARFAALKNGGKLEAPAAAAERIVAFLDQPDFGSQPVADVRDA